MCVIDCSSAHEGGDDDGGGAGIDGQVTGQGRAAGDAGFDAGVSMEGSAPGQQRADGGPGDGGAETGSPPADGSILPLDEDADCGTATIAGRVTVAGEGLEEVEICFVCNAGYNVFRATSVLTNRRGWYSSELAVPEPIAIVLASGGCSVKPRLYGYAFEPSSVHFTSAEMCAGISNADFVARALGLAPNATGSWEVVSSRCLPGSEWSFSCSPRERGTVFTFERGCLFSEESAYCVDGNLYTAGTGICESTYPQRFSERRYYDGEFDEETGTWRITETTEQTAMGSPTMGWTLLSAPAEMVLERVGD
jgi:hypothetical protein